MQESKLKTKKVEQLVRFKLMQLIAGNFTAKESVQMYRDLNKVKIQFSLAQRSGAKQTAVQQPEKGEEPARSPSKSEQNIVNVERKTMEPQKYILKRLNTFNLGNLTPEKETYDFYSFSDLPSTKIECGSGLDTSPNTKVGNRECISPLMQFINGLTLMSISFLKLPASKVCLVNMMYKLGDNKCVDFVNSGDMTNLKHYLRDTIFQWEKRRLDIEVFFWVLWSNFKRKVHNTELDEEREAIFDEIRVFGFTSDFFKILKTLKGTTHIKKETSKKKFDDSDIYHLLKSLFMHTGVNKAFGFLFKLAIDELNLPLSLYSKTKHGEEPTVNNVLYRNFKPKEELGSKMAIILVEVSKKSPIKMEKEFILAFGATINPHFSQSSMMNTSVMTSSNSNYTPVSNNLEISTTDILQARNSHKSNHEDSPILDQNKNKVASVLEKNKAKKADAIDQENYLNSLPVVQEETTFAEDESSSQLTNADKDTESLRFEDEEEDSLNQNQDPVLVESQKNSNQSESNGSDLVEVEVEKVIINIDQFENFELEQASPESTEKENSIKQISETKNKELESLIAKNEKFQERLNKRVWDPTNFMNMLSDYMANVEQNSRIVNLSLKNQGFSQKRFLKRPQYDHFLSKSLMNHNKPVDGITPIYSHEKIASQNTGPFFEKFQLSLEL